jgi:hypothetical protein
MSARLDKVLTIPEVAAIAGWNRRRMFRHLTRVNREVGGMLLRNIGTERHPRWTVTLGALKQIAPQWFTDPETVQARIEALEAEVKQLRRLLTLTNEAVAQLVA